MWWVITGDLDRLFYGISLQMYICDIKREDVLTQNVSLETERYCVRFFQLLCNLIRFSTASLPRRLSIARTICRFDTPRGYQASGDLTKYVLSLTELAPKLVLHGYTDVIRKCNKHTWKPLPFHIDLVTHSCYKPWKHQRQRYDINGVRFRM